MKSTPPAISGITNRFYPVFIVVRTAASCPVCPDGGCQAAFRAEGLRDVHSVTGERAPGGDGGNNAPCEVKKD